MKNPFNLSILFLFAIATYGQPCNNNNTLIAAPFDTIRLAGPGDCDTIPCIRAGEYTLVEVCQGASYSFGTCGGTVWDTKITVYRDGFPPYTAANSLAFNDDACGGFQTQVNFTAPFYGFVQIVLDMNFIGICDHQPNDCVQMYFCQNTPCCQFPNTDAGPDLWACEGDTVQLTGDSAIVYLWLNTSGFVSQSNTQNPWLVVPDSTQQYILQGFNVCGFTYDTMTLHVCHCETMTGLTTTHITKNSARLNWNPFPQAQQYNIRGRIQGSTYWVLLNLPGTAIFKDVAWLSENTVYEWQISAFQSDECSGVWPPPFSNSVFFQTICPPTDSLWVELVTSNGARLSWNQTPGSQGYQVRGRKLGAAGWTNVFVSGGNTVIKDVFGLLPGTTYEWMVRSVCNTNTAFTSTFTYLDTFTTNTSGSRVGTDNSTFSPPDDKPLIYLSGETLKIVMPLMETPSNIQLFDLSGKVVLERKVVTEIDKIEIDELVSGMYLVRVKMGERNFLRKVFLE